jgi:hypothetical protein
VALILLSQEQQLHFAAAFEFVAEQACRDHPGLVQDQQIAGPQVLYDISEGPMLDLGSIALDNHQSRCVARLGGHLGNLFPGKLEVKVASFQSRSHFVGSRVACF